MLCPNIAFEDCLHAWNRSCDQDPLETAGECWLRQAIEGLRVAFLCRVVYIASYRIAHGLEVHQGGWNGICYFPHASNKHRDHGQRGCR